MSFSAVAFIPVYQEMDILPSAVGSLLGQGIYPHVVDNWSTDGCADYCNAIIICPTGRRSDWKDILQYERFPRYRAPRAYNERDILTHIEELAAESKADWCILHDADEIRRSPRYGETYLQALQRFDRDGATAADHQVYNFWPIDESWNGRQDPEEHFEYYSLPDKPLAQVKAWKNVGRVNLSRTGGHVADFHGGIIHPEKLILKHYPIRSTAQGNRKLFRDRIPRWNPEERAMGWHVQYDELAETKEFIKDLKTLTRWNGCLV